MQFRDEMFTGRITSGLTFVILHVAVLRERDLDFLKGGHGFQITKLLAVRA